MRWQGLRRSSNMEDRRGSPAKTISGGAGGLFVMALVVYLLGGDPSGLLMEGVSRTIATSSSRPSEISPEQQQEQLDFTASVLGHTEDVWGQIFGAQGQVYQPPRLVVFAGAVDSACGLGRAAMGPFYCSRDDQVYLDLDFFHELDQRFKAPGDFARAYVIAHEIGHHVQNLQGTLPRVHELQAVAGPRQANALSVKLELQADCYAGIWAKAAQKSGLLDTGDAEEALRAASQIGDDKLQEEMQGYAVPESFTHGSSALRVEWFRRGFTEGTLESCNTF